VLQRRYIQLTQVLKFNAGNCNSHRYLLVKLVKRLTVMLDECVEYMYKRKMTWEIICVDDGTFI
jgi:hypothetical protein